MVRRSGVIEGVGAIDEDIQSSVFDPPHDLEGALAPLIYRLGGNLGHVEREPHVGRVVRAGDHVSSLHHAAADASAVAE